MILITTFDLLRFGQKFTPFVREEWLFPKTKTIEFLQNQEKPYRIMAVDRRIFPPNFSIAYRIESVEGYDPLYLLRYAELIAASERKEPNILPPLGFNRIITPQNFESRIIDLLNVKYVLSLEDLNSPKLKQVFQEGQTKVYENQESFPRVFLVHDVRLATTKQEAMNYLFDKEIDLRKTAIMENPIDMEKTSGEIQDEVRLKDCQPQKITVETKSGKEGILVLSQSYYPSWKAKIDGMKATTYRVDFSLLGIRVPSGNHLIEFYPSL